MNAIIKKSWMTAMSGFTAEQTTEFVIKMVNYQLDGTKPESEDTSVNVALQFAVAELNLPKAQLEVKTPNLKKSAVETEESLEVEFEDEKSNENIYIDNNIYNNKEDKEEVILSYHYKEEKEESAKKEEESSAKEEGISPTRIAELYNSICMHFPRILRPYRLGDKRVQHIRTRNRIHSINEWRKVFENMENSDFCRRSGTFSFDWIIKSETNFCKMLEGNYNQTRQVQRIQPQQESVLEKNQRALRELGITEDNILNWER